ncbi:MAG: alanine--glyoxylate aminotransferase family protein [Alphaproteobacteria bacterium]|nr:alanine--glyoxylate aminotransferase family protein [Alphaproteobacteria bacterium]
MKLFTVGPVQLYKQVAEVKREEIPYFRTEEYGGMVKGCLKGLAELLGTEYNDNILYLTASGTAAMEAVIENCFTALDKLLVINGGSFGHRFCELCAWHKIPYDAIELKWDETLTASHLQPFAGKGYTALIVNLHETSVGQLYDLKMLSEFCRQNNMYLVVDAISTFLADDYAMDDNGVDVTIFSSQKGLCLSPGLSFVAFSERMKQRVLLQGRAASAYFDFRDYFRNISRGQTPYTPAVFIMYELQAMLKVISSFGGKAAWLADIKAKAEHFRTTAASAGLKVKSSTPQSNMMTVLEFDGVSARDIFLALAAEYQIYVNPCGGELADRLMRVSHAGNITKADLDDLLAKILQIKTALEAQQCAA